MVQVTGKAKGVKRAKAGTPRNLDSPYWVIVTFGEAGDTVCFRMYIMSYEP